MRRGFPWWWRSIGSGTALSSRMPLLFDGDCGFCTGAIAWLRRRFDPAAASEPWQEADLAALGVSEEACRQAVQWVGNGTRRPAPTRSPPGSARRDASGPSSASSRSGCRSDGSSTRWWRGTGVGSALWSVDDPPRRSGSRRHEDRGDRRRRRERDPRPGEAADADRGRPARDRPGARSRAARGRGGGGRRAGLARRRRRRRAGRGRREGGHRSRARAT